MALSGTHWIGFRPMRSKDSGVRHLPRYHAMPCVVARLWALCRLRLTTTDGGCTGFRPRLVPKHAGGRLPCCFVPSCVVPWKKLNGTSVLPMAGALPSFLQFPETIRTRPRRMASPGQKGRKNEELPLELGPGSRRVPCCCKMPGQQFREAFNAVQLNCVML